jgi:hypothetical protein
VRGRSPATPMTATLAEQLEQSSIQSQDLPGTTHPKGALIDLGFRGVDVNASSVHLINHGKHKTLTSTQRRWLKRRQAIEPIIGHVKHDARYASLLAQRAHRRCAARRAVRPRATTCAGCRARLFARVWGPFFCPRLAAFDCQCPVASAARAPGTLPAA